MRKHTPGKVEQHNLMVIEAGALVSDYRGICHCGLGLRPDAHESEANAAFITRAWNSHYALLEACEANQRNLAAQLTARMAALNRLNGEVTDDEFMRLSSEASALETKAAELTTAALELVATQ